MYDSEARKKRFLRDRYGSLGRKYGVRLNRTDKRQALDEHRGAQSLRNITDIGVRLQL
jgi:hypothetical protein